MNLQKAETKAEILSDPVNNDEDPPDLCPSELNRLTIDVICKNECWTAQQTIQARQAAAFAFKAVKPAGISLGISSNISSDISMALVLADGAFIQTLNARFCGINRPTNVLAFPANDITLLGDVIIAHDILRREAAEKKITLHAHLAHLAAHGTLHLLGFDHDGDENAKIMEALEISILAEIGISNPYHFHEEDA